MEQNRQRILLVSSIQSPVAAAECVVECSHVPADSCSLLIGKLNEFACEVQRFFTVTEWQLVLKNIDLLLDPHAVFLDVALFCAVAVCLADVVQQCDDDESFRRINLAVRVEIEFSANIYAVHKQSALECPVIFCACRGSKEVCLLLKIADKLLNTVPVRRAKHLDKIVR